MSSADALWVIGDYASVGELWAQAARDVVAWLEPHDEDVLDLACGTGAGAIAAHHAGARSVTGVDVTRRLLDEARRRAQAIGMRATWIEADVQALPLADDSADVVLSTFGLIFATDPQQALDEARRVARPGAPIVLTSWCGEGAFGQMRAVLGPFAPTMPPPPWHDSEARLREVVGDAAEIHARDVIVRAPSADAFVAQLERESGPIMTASQWIGPRWDEAREALVRRFESLGEQRDEGFALPVRYLVTRLIA